jgi:hypothetical protein
MTNQANQQQRGLKSTDLRCSQLRSTQRVHSRSALNVSAKAVVRFVRLNLDNESDKNAFRRLALPMTFGLWHVFLTRRCSTQGASDAIAFSHGIDVIYFR